VGEVRAIDDVENVELATVGIDIGSSTSHLVFSRVLMRRDAPGLSSRFVVAAREVRWRSPIILTPYQPGCSSTRAPWAGSSTSATGRPA